MKKIKLFLCVALFGAMSYGAFTAYDYYTMSEEERFFLANIEALTQKEPDGGYYRNFKSATYWYNSEIAGGVAVSEEPGFWVSGTWVSMVCCGPGTDMDACNFNMEDNECQRRVQRPSRG